MENSKIKQELEKQEDAQPVGKEIVVKLLTEETRIALLEYLSYRPYREVYGMVQELSTLATR